MGLRSPVTCAKPTTSDDAMVFDSRSVIPSDRSSKWSVRSARIIGTDPIAELPIATIEPLIKPKSGREAHAAFVAALQGHELGDGIVHRVCAETQRRYLNPPALGRNTGLPRWARRGGGIRRTEATAEQ